LNQAFYRAIAVPEVVLLALDENQVVYGDIFPRIPLIPQFALAPECFWPGCLLAPNKAPHP
jgi:hypothetical protein